MSQAKRLSDEEIGKIKILKELGFSQRAIASKIGRSKTVIQHFLSSSNSPASVKRSGRKRSLGKRMLRKIMKYASNNITTARKIQARFGLEISRRTIIRYLTRSGSFKYQKMKPCPKLSPVDRQRRMDYAFKYLDWTAEWESVIFSDEKKFNLDGPDGFHFYWRDINKDKISYSKRVLGGGSVMIWLGFCSKGRTPVCFISTKMNSQRYVELLQTNLLPFASSVLPEKFIFQQDNAPCHRANNTKNWLQRMGVDLIDHPPRSPDLNPIENLFGRLANIVYDDGKQYDEVEELKSAIITAWHSIDESELINLVASMHGRMIDIIKKLGAAINY